MWAKFKAWIANVGNFMLRFTKTTASKFIDKYGEVAMACVTKAAMHPGSGEEKFAYACACFMAKVPEAATYLVQTAIQVAYAIYKEDQAKP